MREMFTVLGRHSSETGVRGYMGDELEEDDGGRTLCCFPSMSSLRYTRRKADSFDRGEPGSSFSPLDVDPAEKVGRALRSLSVRAFCICCCEPMRSDKWIVEVRGVDVKKEHGSDDRLRTAARCEVVVNDEYFKPPMWKQLIRKVKAQAKYVHDSRSEWLNYDPQSYEKNFDNGEFRQQNLSSVNQKDDRGATESALHTALLQRFASSRSQQDATTPTSLIHSPAPVKLRNSNEEFEKANEDFVPIWQRRAAKLDFRQ